MADDPAPPRFTTRDLAVLSGVSERTVRYYVGEGLLPPPASRGRGANFDEGHLTRLRLIRVMQQAGNDLETIREYLGQLDHELTATGASLESALAIWNGRVEQAVWRDQLRKIWSPPQALHRHRIAEGVELLVDQQSAPSPARMRSLLKLVREAFKSED